MRVLHLAGAILAAMVFASSPAKAFGSVELIIRTAADDDGGSFAGTYKLSIADATASTGSDSNTIDYSGAVTCFAE